MSRILVKKRNIWTALGSQMEAHSSDPSPLAFLNFLKAIVHAPPPPIPPHSGAARARLFLEA